MGGLCVRSRRGYRSYVRRRVRCSSSSRVICVLFHRSTVTFWCVRLGLRDPDLSPTLTLGPCSPTRARQVLCKLKALVCGTQSTLWQTHDAVERQDLRSHLTASCDELESETVDAAWRWIRRSARLQYAVDGARAALDFSAADDRTDDLFRLKLATLTREVRALVTRRQFGQEAKAQPARRVNVPGRLVVQGCVGMLRLAPAWMHQVAQVRPNALPMPSVEPSFQYPGSNLSFRR